jgi:DNA repair protein RecO (recombination protein O)
MLREREGVMVGRYDLGESDRIFRWLIPEEGRVSAVIKGARKPGSPAAQLDIGVRARLVLREGRGELHLLQEVELMEQRLKIRSDLNKLAAMIHACEVCGVLAREDQPEPRLYGLLEIALLLLEEIDELPQSSFGMALEAKALTFAGIAPPLTRCAHCREPLTGALAWEDSVVHQHCAVWATLPISQEWVEALEMARKAPLQDSYFKAIPEGPRDCLTRLVEAQAGRPLGCRAWMEGLAMAG